MWVGLDWFASILIIATVATTVLLTFVILVMLLCSQPVRRIVLARAAIVLSLLMLPLVESNPLPRSGILSRLPRLEEFWASKSIAVADPAVGVEGARPEPTLARLPDGSGLPRPRVRATDPAPHPEDRSGGADGASDG